MVSLHESPVTENDQELRYVAVPGNLCVLGTENSSDRSVGTIDLALRRRFAWEGSEADDGGGSPWEGCDSGAVCTGSAGIPDTPRTAGDYATMLCVS